MKALKAEKEVLEYASISNEDHMSLLDRPLGHTSRPGGHDYIQVHLLIGSQWTLCLAVLDMLRRNK